MMSMSGKQIFENELNVKSATVLRFLCPEGILAWVYPGFFPVQANLCLHRRFKFIADAVLLAYPQGADRTVAGLQLGLQPAQAGVGLRGVNQFLKAGLVLQTDVFG